MRNIFYIICIVIILLPGCNKKRQDVFVCTPSENTKDIKKQSLILDSIQLEDINTSSFGESCFINENIAFIDKHFCTVSLFDTTGHFLCTYLGQGMGPKETQVGRIAAHAFTKDDRLALLGYNLDIHLFDKDFVFDRVSTIERTKKDQVAESSLTYTNQYSDMVCRSYGNCMYMNIYSEHPSFNYLEHTEEYLNKCKHIWEIDIKNGRTKRLLASGYPSVYRDDPHKHTIFLGTCFDIDKDGNFYVNYDVDSLIYVYDFAFSPIKTFGYSGGDMNQNYQSIYDYKDCRKNYRKERNEKGYYYWIEYVDETGILFRSYRKDTEKDGLQIYEEGRLIADVEIPKKFRVMGYKEPYYYSYIIPKLDENDDSLWIYRFKL